MRLEARHGEALRGVWGSGKVLPDIKTYRSSRIQSQHHEARQTVIMRLERYDSSPRGPITPPSFLVLKPVQDFGRELRPNCLQRRARLMERPRKCLSIVFACKDYLNTSNPVELCPSLVTTRSYKR